jgi:hypothetical protein
MGKQDTMNVPAAAPTQDAGPDPAWDRLYQAGGISAALFVVLLVAAIALSIVSPPPPTTGGATTLEYIAEHRPMYIIHQQLWLVPGVFGAIVYLALYMALKHVHQSYAAMGAVVGGLAWALTLAMPTTSTGAPALVYLSDQYAATTDAGQRAAFVAAAESLIALNRTPTVVGVLTTIGMLIVSLVMLRAYSPGPSPISVFSPLSWALSAKRSGRSSKVGTESTGCSSWSGWARLAGGCTDWGRT